MDYVVGVHGILNYAYFRKERTAAGAARAASREWTSWLGAPVEVAYYAHLLHRTQQGSDDEVDALDDFAQDLLIAWVDELRGKQAVAQGSRLARARAASDWLTRRHGRTSRLLMFAFVREASTYLRSPDGKRRRSARDEVAGVIAAASHQERVVVAAHSLGSVVTYEALWATPDLRVDLLVTLGSPLGIPGVVFDRLTPPPVDGRGLRPPGVKRWINLADVGDPVAVPTSGLGPLFTGLDPEPAPLEIANWD